MRFKAPTAKLRGRVRYTFLDENDQPTFAHDQHGNAIWGGHWNSNLITDAGMDAIATDYVRSYPGTLGATIEQTWRKYAHIGTGSTAPANADTVLDAEVMTSDSNGGFSDVETYNSPAGGFITAEYQITRVFTLASSQNLTEYGFSDDEGSLHIRELFRDEEGDPITISIAAGKKLRLDHTLEITLPWGAASETFDIEEYDASDSLVATHEITADCTFFATSSNRYSQMFYCALPRLGVLAATRFLRYTLTAPVSNAPDQPIAVDEQSVNRASWASDEYTPGSHTLRQYGVFTETQANGEIRGFAVGVLDNPREHGFKVVLTSPASFEKADTHTLELSVELSWARG